MTWHGVTELSLVSLYLNLMIFLSGILHLRHMVMLLNFIKKNRTHRSRAIFFSEGVINVWNQLPVSTDFRSLSSFMHSICCIDLSSYLHI